ncbi:MarR family transcriptional regulator [Microcoleus sp. FACHB-672]|uniref:MarR family transcriptional regulator n=1 Tax=Microcoleus sp. FACHB-672 TaxID=2692825 RepID=UPI00168A1360|nr:helix-turn-helix domain-containing protein [Microcoleus sp. FACHB-672]MBD2039693.1 hypothetical protein [Microcoleus sp. FACHB-672]
MTQQHYRITLEEAINHHKDGWLTSTALLYYYFRIRMKAGWKVTLHQKEITELLGISRASFYRAIEQLSAKGLIEWEAPSGLVVELKRQPADSLTDETPSLTDETPSLTDETPSLTDETPSLTDETPSLTDETATPLKALPSEEPKNPSYSYQSSYQTFFKSLSESEREKFLNFANKAAEDLPKPPKLPRRWIERNFEDLARQWAKAEGKPQQSPQSQVWENHPRRADWTAQIVNEGYFPFISAAGSSAERAERKLFFDWARAAGWLEEAS